jgi:hypothetical protein
MPLTIDRIKERGHRWELDAVKQDRKAQNIRVKEQEVYDDAIATAREYKFDAANVASAEEMARWERTRQEGIALDADKWAAIFRARAASAKEGTILLGRNELNDDRYMADPVVRAAIDEDLVDYQDPEFSEQPGTPVTAWETRPSNADQI